MTLVIIAERKVMIDFFGLLVYLLFLGHHKNECHDYKRKQKRNQNNRGQQGGQNGGNNSGQGGNKSGGEQSGQVQSGLKSEN